jgi:heme/copper-type cytochrome/quinol oxidase subunit 2
MTAVISYSDIATETEAVEPVAAKDNSKVVIIAGSVGGGLAIIVAIVIGLLIYKCRKSPVEENEMNPQNNMDPNMAMTLENPLTDKGDGDQREREDAWMDGSE